MYAISPVVQGDQEQIVFIKSSGKQKLFFSQTKNDQILLLKIYYCTKPITWYYLI